MLRIGRVAQHHFLIRADVTALGTLKIVLGDLVRPPLPRLIVEHSTTAATERRPLLLLIWLTLGLGGRGCRPTAPRSA
jgi:hypothetical protein